LVVAAAFADGSGSPSAAFYAFLGLVAVAAVVALNAYGELVETPRIGRDETTRRLQAVLWAVLLGLAVLGAAARAPALGEGAVPHAGSTVLIACLLVLCTEGIVELVVISRRRPVRRVRAAPARPPAAQNVSEETASLARSING
jgi:hypothetical protein